MKLSRANIKKFLIISQKKVFFMFEATETRKKIPYALGSGTF